ncbi:homoserine O-succinyltransferase [Jeotgalibaca ciconiae]|uniref:Homoserine O-acetyltransferase n=1 Tax=Jeotgalibaca ciconiae TaxID=2496265 RepID=A0A3S9H811_9LACT|nr:homoserine O-succinyltransferase [Jeotgalibaca ciconiae]AZP03488.1 homoserine O-succinyltransferase [Jeotgalibaca ciconiae]HJB23278.1 homoserine O-succinyltransferase [Candidatus Jeotgalibaca pullicola]
MPLIVAKGLPAIVPLTSEGIEFSDDLPRCSKYLKVLILNLMPTKEDTERQLLRLLGDTEVPIQVEFIYLTSRESKNVTKKHLEEFYKTFPQIKDQHFDGLVITGAPVEHLSFEEVAYNEELKEILQWSQQHAAYRFFICWGAQFALNYYYQIEKKKLPQKLFGVFEYQIQNKQHPYLKGFPEQYTVPQSRHTRIDYQELCKIDDLQVLSCHQEYGPDMIVKNDKRDLFVFGHLEYERDTLQNEYNRDIAKGEDISMPENYYCDEKTKMDPILNWRCSSRLLWSNWIKELYQKKG